MGQVTWSRSAWEDVEAIASYIARDSEDRASLFVVRLLEAADRLRDFPGSGRAIPEMGDPSCREIIVYPYRVMYRVEDDQVLITAVVHGARDWRPE
jgi:toxin ParE1/3/4